MPSLVRRATGLDRNTIVLLTSDHGEELFEHGGFDHGDTLYDEVLRVPLILWGPGRIPGRSGIFERNHPGAIAGFRAPITLSGLKSKEAASP